MDINFTSTGDVTVNEFLKIVACRFGWVEKVTNPDIPEELMDNPVTFEQFLKEKIAYDYKTAYQDQVLADMQKDAMDQIQDVKDNIILE